MYWKADRGLGHERRPVSYTHLESFGEETKRWVESKEKERQKGREEDERRRQKEREERRQKEREEEERRQKEREERRQKELSLIHISSDFSSYRQEGTENVCHSEPL